MAKSVKSLRDLEIRVNDAVTRLREIETKLKSPRITTGLRSSLLKSRATMISQLKSLSLSLNSYGEGQIVRVKFRAIFEGMPPVTYQRYLVNVPETEVPSLMQHKHGSKICYIEILEIRVIPTSGSLEKL